PDAGGRDVVVVGGHQAGMLGGLTAQQRTTGDHATVGDTGHQLADPFRHGATDGDVVLDEQRLRTADDEIVDHHRDQVHPDGVVFVHGLGDRQFGAHPVG